MRTSTVVWVMSSTWVLIGLPRWLFLQEGQAVEGNKSELGAHVRDGNSSCTAVALYPQNNLLEPCSLHCKR